MIPIDSIKKIAIGSRIHLATEYGEYTITRLSPSTIGNREHYIHIRHDGEYDVCLSEQHTLSEKSLEKD